MNIIKLIQKTISKCTTPSDEQLLAKAYNIYHQFASYHHLQHTHSGYLAAVKRKNEMHALLKDLHHMKGSEDRTKKLKETIVLFKKYNRIGFQ